MAERIRTGADRTRVHIGLAAGHTSVAVVVVVGTLPVGEPTSLDDDVLATETVRCDVNDRNEAKLTSNICRFCSALWRLSCSRSSSVPTTFSFSLPRNPVFFFGPPTGVTYPPARSEDDPTEGDPTEGLGVTTGGVGGALY